MTLKFGMQILSSKMIKIQALMRLLQTALRREVEARLK
jgi:hypothetical protein